MQEQVVDLINQMTENVESEAKKLNFEGYTLEWGGDFKTIKDFPHIQLKNWKNYK